MSGTGPMSFEDARGALGRQRLEENFRKPLTGVEEPLYAGLTVGFRPWAYTLLAERGRGAAGHVWEVENAESRERFALKILRPRADLLKRSSFDDIAARFRREAEFGATLEHANIVKYMRRGEYLGCPYIVMQLADSTLSVATGSWSLMSAQEVILSVASGLTHLHQKGHTHRDIKLANILRRGSNYVIGDLGSVRWSDIQEVCLSSRRHSEQVLGSFRYMAPEQRMARNIVTPAADVFALGMTWHELLTGKTLDATQAVSGHFSDPSRSEVVNRVIREMLQYRPVDRPQARDIVEMFDSSSWA